MTLKAYSMIQLIHEEDQEHGESIRVEISNLNGFVFYTLGKNNLIWTFVLTTLKMPLNTNMPYLPEMTRESNHTYGLI